MLPKKERLSRSEFDRFFSLGKRIHSPHFTIIYTKHPNPHVAVVVSKKVAKTAVVRNKLRRRSYDIVRRHQNETGRTGVYICITKPKANLCSYKELKHELTSTLNQVTP